MVEPIIKVCGMRDGPNILEVDALDIDWMGFILWPGSPRYVGEGPVSMPRRARRVGVFVDQEIAEVASRAGELSLDLVQLHGNETPEYCGELSRALEALGRRVGLVKAFRVASAADLRDTAPYEPFCGHFLFDTPTAAMGGSGRRFDWGLLGAYRGNRPFILSGGIGPGDAGALRGLSHPRWAGVDLNSRFETSPGMKDPESLNRFIGEFRKAPRVQPQGKRHNQRDMNRIDRMFGEKARDILAVYFCAGHPSPEGVRDTIKALEAGGIDMVEIGIPFSDPMADGPVIQDAATKALRGGMSLRRLFSTLEGIREEVGIPLVLMGYLNPIMRYGFESFCRDCARCGIDGAIIPDLPFNDYVRDFRDTATRHGVRIAMLITPETSEERIRLIDENTDGFIYMVSSAATTGEQESFGRDRQEYFDRVGAMGLRNPRLIGFGISNRQTWDCAREGAAGGIVGSKFVRLLEETGSPEEAVAALLGALGRQGPI